MILQFLKKAIQRLSYLESVSCSPLQIYICVHVQNVLQLNSKHSMSA